MGVTEVRVDFPGLLIERHRNGSARIRVRVEGSPGRRIAIPVGADHPDFAHHYHAARAGEVWSPPAPRMAERSLDWLTSRYLAHLERLVQAGQASRATLNQRRSVLTRVCDHLDPAGYRYGSFDMDAPSSAFVRLRDEWAATPGAADNMVKSVRAVYRWAMERHEIAHNPAAGIGAINTTPRGGAVPWTAADLTRFREHHPAGTTAHLWLTLQAFTACRIGDAIWLGRGQEVARDGQLWLEWQPRKRGSAFVALPMLPPLVKATRAATVTGATYLLSETGRPFASVEALRVRVQRWCAAAGLPDRSSHGVRKAMAETMAEAGCSQHQIMAVMAHTQAKTSEVYTRGVQRRGLAADGVRALSALDW